MKTLRVAALLLAGAASIVTIPNLAQGAGTQSGVVAPPKKVSIYRNPGKEKMRVMFEIQCDTSQAVPSREDPNVTAFLAAVLYVPGGNSKAVIDNGDDTIATYTMDVGVGRSVVLETYGKAEKGQRGCAWTLTHEKISPQLGD